MKLLPKFKSSKGFTLIELLVALTILVILAVSVYVALNPAQRLKDAKDARRTSDVDSILTAIHQSIVDNKGAMPTNMPAVDIWQQIGEGTNTDCPVTAIGTYCTDTLLDNVPPGEGTWTVGCAKLASGSQNVLKYLASVPVDPVGGTVVDSNKTGFAVKRNTNGIVTVRACYTDGTAVIETSR